MLEQTGLTDMIVSYYTKLPDPRGLDVGSAQNREESANSTFSKLMETYPLFEIRFEVMETNPALSRNKSRRPTTPRTDPKKIIYGLA